MSLLDGMEKFGLDVKKIEEATKKKAEEEKKKEESKKKKEDQEEDLVYVKEFTCPLCDNKFKQPVIKGSRVRLIATDKDLRPIHKNVDSIKYDIVHCNKCGYAVLSRYFGPMAKPHKEMLKNNISSRYKPMLEVGATISYSQAFSKYQLALINAKCRLAKNSEIGLIYLKLAWLIRGMHENIATLPPQKKEFSEENLIALEEEALKNAMDNFLAARLNENPPIAGMNEVTLDYLLAVLCIRFEDYDNASKLVQGILSSQQAGSTQKDKARELKDEIREKMK